MSTTMTAESHPDQPPAPEPVPAEQASGKRWSWEPDFIDPPARTGRPRWVGVSIGFAVPAVLAGAAFLIIDPWSMDAMTCERLGNEAVKVSEFQDPAAHLIDVTSEELVSDDRATYRVPTGNERTVVMTCSATGEWKHRSADITMTLEVDSEDRMLVYYEKTPGGKTSAAV